MNKGFSVLSPIMKETNQSSSVTSGLIIIIPRCFMNKSLRRKIIVHYGQITEDEYFFIDQIQHISKLFAKKDLA